MKSTSITDEIRAIRRGLAAKFNNDLDLILADIRRREGLDNRTYITRSPRWTSNQPDEQSPPNSAADSSAGGDAMPSK